MASPRVDEETVLSGCAARGPGGYCVTRRCARGADSRSLEAHWLRHFDTVERLAEMGSWRLDLTNATMDWTRQARCLFGISPDRPGPPWHRFLLFFPVNDRMVLMQAIDRAIDTGMSFEVEAEIVTQTGRRRRLRNVGEIDGGGGPRPTLVCVCQDITVRHEIERALERSAMVDELTGIANRAALNMFLTEQIEQRIGDAGLAVVLIDLDNFKRVNDTYGHQAGDDVLQRVAQTLVSQGEGFGFVARLGGDEFVLAITEAERIATVRTVLAKLLADLTIEVNGGAGPITVRATMGACLFDQGITTRSEILRRADLSLYNAKALGKGRAMVAGDLRPILPMTTDGRAS